MKWTIYHNPRCSKSRQTLALLEEQGIEPQVRLYLQDPPTQAELKNLLRALGMQATELIRPKEKIIQDESLDVSTQASALKAMSQHPILIERPIVMKGDQKAVLGRPPEQINTLL